MADMNDISRAESVKRGSLLIIQGQEPRYMYYLHKGALEILSASDEFMGLSPDIIISKSKRVGVIRENSLISGLSILFSEPNKKSIRAIEDCMVTRYPIREGGFPQIVAENMQLAVTILSNLFKRLEISIPDANKYMKLYQNIAMIIDNLSLMYKSFNQGSIGEKLQQRANQLYDTYVLNGGDFPRVFDARFLVTDNSAMLKKKYSFPGLPMEALVDINQCNFLNRLISVDANLLSSLMKKDTGIPVYMFETISGNLMRVLDRIEAIHNEIDDELALLFGGEASWTNFLIDRSGLQGWQRTGRIAPDFAKNFLSMAVKIHTYFEEISGKKLSEIYPGFKNLHQYYVGQAKAPARDTEEAGTAKAKPRGKEYNNSLQQIFEFSLIEKEFQKNFLKLLSDFKKMQNPFNTEPEGRKLRRYITKMYLDLYSQVFIRSKSESTLPAPVRLMLLFGYIDENMLDDGQVAELHELSLRAPETTGIPIYTEQEFLSLVHGGQENPSITEMGMTYEQHLLEEGKHKKASERVAPKDSDGIGKALYEVEHRVLHTTAVCSGSTATAFPILTSMVMKSNPSSLYVSKKKLESVIRSLREIDFSVFYRETVERVGEAREVIQDEVIPNFILLPSFGTKTMLWQELDGTNRKTRGRIVVPLLFMGDLVKSMAHTLACFRWELNRTLKGAMWADPVEGGFTGVYFDYVNFYKKNSKLSTEAKEKISERFKSIRTNRDRFADDYVQWILFEREGIMKLNNVVREMFYRYVPFKKEIRDKLENMPAFSEIATKFKNIQRRDITAYERKFKKYMTDGGTLPDALQRFMNFLEM